MTQQEKNKFIDGLNNATYKCRFALDKMDSEEFKNSAGVLQGIMFSLYVLGCYAVCEGEGNAFKYVDIVEREVNKNDR